MYNLRQNDNLFICILISIIMSCGFPQFPCIICGYLGHRQNSCKKSRSYNKSPYTYYQNEISTLQLLSSYEKWLLDILRRTK